MELTDEQWKDMLDKAYEIHDEVYNKLKEED